MFSFGLLQKICQIQKLRPFFQNSTKKTVLSKTGCYMYEMIYAQKFAQIQNLLIQSTMLEEEYLKWDQLYRSGIFITSKRFGNVLPLLKYNTTNGRLCFFSLSLFSPCLPISEYAFYSFLLFAPKSSIQADLDSFFFIFGDFAYCIFNKATTEVESFFVSFLLYYGHKQYSSFQI